MSAHKFLSYIKSTFRMIGYLLLLVGAFRSTALIFAALFLIIAEVFGFVEEWEE